jgi:predicted MFS family arabinose efflux permease
MSFFGFPYIVLLPAVAHGLGLDAQGLGWLMACVGGGAVTGGLVMGGLVRDGGAKFAVRGAIGFGIVLSGFAVVDTTAGTMAVLFFLGALQTMSIAALTTTIQTSVHDGMRGRVMSMVMVIFFGFSTLGGLVAGLLGDRFTVPTALATGGVVTAAVAVVLARARTFT